MDVYAQMIFGKYMQCAINCAFCNFVELYWINRLYIASHVITLNMRTKCLMKEGI